MKIAVLGTRGIPAEQGGVERHVEELYKRLAAKHDITVYCRNSYTSDDSAEYKGIKLRHLPNINSKHLDAISHTFLGALDTILRKYDVVHFHAIGPSLLSFLSKLKRRTKIVSTVHALDWQRDKWGGFAKSALKLGERASVAFPDTTICVSKEIQSYLKEKYGASAQYIPNGINEPVMAEASEIKKFSLDKHNYILFLGRLVPEKNCHLLIKAFKSLDTDLKLVIAGDAGHTNGYYDNLVKEAAGDKRIVFTGVVTGRLLQELYTNAYMFVLPSNLEGLPVVLLEALSYGLPTLCSDIKPNLEVVGDNGQHATVFASDNYDELREKLLSMVKSRQKLQEKAQKGREHVLRAYDWDEIASLTEQVYQAN